MRHIEEDAGGTGGGDAVPELKGFVAVDVSATLLTNTLPIRRLGLGSEKSAELDVVYVAIPELVVRPET
jgi:hypothetical protein